MRPETMVIELSDLFAQRRDKAVLNSAGQQSNIALVNPCAEYINAKAHPQTTCVERVSGGLKPTPGVVAKGQNMNFSKSMDWSFSIGHALPLPSGRILRFACGCAKGAPAGNLSLRHRVASGCCANRCVISASRLPQRCRTASFTLHSPCI